jgi:hypothetical protein
MSSKPPNKSKQGAGASLPSFFSLPIGEENVTETDEELLLIGQAYTISGYDLTKHVMKEKQYAGMAPMERFLYEGGSSLQRRATRMVPKGLL